ncbi:MAG: hypothetical protein R3B40_22330 [Polyangiales bacterium]|nr:hypothetical protein [Myxococcales bacterium]MCB9656805.1 hypothetical protein [Sandaracinaceae bacterium]
MPKSLHPTHTTRTTRSTRSTRTDAVLCARLSASVLLLAMGLAGCGDETGPTPDGGARDGGAQDQGSGDLGGGGDQGMGPVDLGGEPVCEGSFVPSCENVQVSEHCTALSGCSLTGTGFCALRQDVVINGQPPDCDALTTEAACEAVTECEFYADCAGTINYTDCDEAPTREVCAQLSVCRMPCFTSACPTNYDCVDGPDPGPDLFCVRRNTRF